MRSSFFVVAVEECVIFNGGKAAILDAKLKMYKRLDDIVEVTRTVSKDLVSFLLSIRDFNMIKI
jgi:hypothetical protein